MRLKFRPRSDLGPSPSQPCRCQSRPRPAAEWAPPCSRVGPALQQSGPRPARLPLSEPDRPCRRVGTALRDCRCQSRTRPAAEWAAPYATAVVRVGSLCGRVGSALRDCRCQSRLALRQSRPRCSARLSLSESGRSAAEYDRGQISSCHGLFSGYVTWKRPNFDFN
jgi:hypothetical protein